MHLEPNCYYLQLEQVENNYKVKIFNSDEYDGPRQLIKVFEGNYENIVPPLYRGLKKFNSFSYKEPHWPELEKNRICELTELIKNKKNING